jgi:hypothetical protein
VDVATAAVWGAINLACLAGVRKATGAVFTSVEGLVTTTSNPPPRLVLAPENELLLLAELALLVCCWKLRLFPGVMILYTAVCC